MARIRSIKPEFFRHELLQELEMMHPKQYVMLTFAALWTQCDNRGIFRDKARTLRLDILPFLDFDFSETLNILAFHGFITRYDIDGEQYGRVLEFGKHQRITGKEASEDGSKYPDEQGNIRETSGKQSGNDQLPRKGKEGKGKEYTPGFEIFWTEYPRKEAKGKAAEIWNRDGLEEKTDMIVAKVKTYSRTAQWKKENGKYVPHPSTFLNQARYDDDPGVTFGSRFEETL